MPRKTFVVLLIPFLFLFTLKTHRTFAGDGDEPHYLLIAESLLDDGDLDLENQYPDRHALMPALPEVHGILTPKELLFPHHDVGMPVLMLPMLAIAHVLIPRIPPGVLSAMHMQEPAKVTVALFSMQSMLVTVLLTWLMLLYLRQQGIQDPWVTFGALLAVTTPPLMMYGFLFFTEIYSATALLAVVVLFRQSSSRWRTVGVSAMVFLLSWLHVKNLPLAVVIPLSWWLDLRWKDSGSGGFERWWPALALVLALGLRLLLHHHYFGQYLLFPPRQDTGWWSWSALLASPLALLFDQAMGLLWHNFLLWLFAAGLMVKARDAHWRKLEGFWMLCYVIPFLPYAGWDGGWTPPARHLITIVPLLWPGIIQIGQSLWARSRTGRWATLMLTAGTLGISFYYWQFPRKISYEPWYPNAWIHALFPNMTYTSFPLASFVQPIQSWGLPVLIWLTVLIVISALVLAHLKMIFLRRTSPHNLQH